MKHPLYLIEALNGEGKKISIVCNDAKKSAQEISDLYRNRWQIELFFKWIKQHLVLKKCYGKSANAVFNQIYIARITFCLTLLLKTKLGCTGTLLDLFEWIGDLWAKKLSAMVEKLFKKPKRSSKGRRRMNHQQIFEGTESQYV